MINLRITFKFISSIFIFLFSSTVFNQSVEDLEYLNLLPESQAQSIAGKLGLEQKLCLDELVIKSRLNYDLKEFKL